MKSRVEERPNKLHSRVRLRQSCRRSSQTPWLRKRRSSLISSLVLIDVPTTSARLATLGQQTRQKEKVRHNKITWPPRWIVMIMHWVESLLVLRSSNKIKRLRSRKPRDGQSRLDSAVRGKTHLLLPTPINRTRIVKSFSTDKMINLTVARGMTWPLQQSISTWNSTNNN